MTAAPPLDGCRVLELGAALAGPWCAHVLAALGAEVVKIEPLSGDESRAGGPPLWNGESPLFLAANGNKRSIAVNLRAEKSREIVHGLAEKVDVVVQNLRPGAVERLGLDSERLRRLNPRLVYCNIGAFGTRGPLRDAPAYDALIQGMTGIMSSTRESEADPPLRTGPSIIDIGTGLWAAIGILAALRARDRDGEGQVVDTSLFETGVNWQPMQILSYLAVGEVQPPPGRASLIYAPFQAFDTTDGSIVVGAGNDRLFEALVRELELPDLLGEERFAGNVNRVRNREELASILAARFAERSTAEWLERLRSAGLPAGPVQDVEQLLGDPQFTALELLQDIPHPKIPELQLLTTPLGFNGVRPQYRRPPPELGQDTREVLGELGYRGEDIDRLVREDTVGVAAARPDSGPDR